MNLNQVTVPVLDVSRSIRFYRKMGLKLIVEALPDYARFELPEGDATFSLHRVDTLPEGAGIWVYFETRCLDDLVAELQNEGIQFEGLPEDKRWLWREARLRDPDGNRLILYYAGSNRKDPPWRIE